MRDCGGGVGAAGARGAGGTGGRAAAGAVAGVVPDSGRVEGQVEVHERWVDISPPNRAAETGIAPDAEAEPAANHDYGQPPPTNPCGDCGASLAPQS